MNVFRPATEVPDIVDTVLERDDIATVWLRRGIVHDAAAGRVETTGRAVVQDQCMKVEYKRLIG